MQNPPPIVPWLAFCGSENGWKKIDGEKAAKESVYILSEDKVADKSIKID